MISSNIKAIEKQIKRDMTRLQRQVFPKAQRFAINKVANKTRTRSVKAISKRFRIKQKIIKGRTRVWTTARGAVVFRTFIEPVPVSVLTPRKGQLPKQTKKGVRVAGRHFPHAFVATVGKKRSIFQRVGRPRLPIKVVTVDINRQAKPIIMTVAKRVVRADYGKELKRQIERLSKQKLGR